MTPSSARSTRREFATLAVGCLPLSFLRAAADDAPQSLASFAKLGDRWGADHLYEFVNHLPDVGRLSLKQALEVESRDATVQALKGKSRDMAEIQKELLWVSNHFVAYWFKDKAAIEYHDVVAWVAETAGVSKARIAASSTFALEHAILQHLFANLWDKLDHDQRMEVLKEIDPDGKIKDRAAAVAHDGRAALNQFRKVVRLRGFNFYTTMSRVICAVARLFRVTLPFAAYTGAARLVAFFAGPVGWAIMAVLAAVELAIAGRADPRRTTAFVLQIHLQRIAAVLEAGWPEDRVFPPSILFPGAGQLEANREAAAEWERFRLVRNTNGTWSFAAATGYLCAEDGGGRKVVANRDQIGEWEQWTWIDRPGGKVSLRTQSGSYLCVEPGGTVVADRREVGEWEEFEISRDAAGHSCTIKTWEGKFLSAQQD